MGYRYIGSKAKLVKDIIGRVDNIFNHSIDKTVVDLMSGTGTVARAFKDFGYNVIANDIMTYSFIHNIVGLHVMAPPTFDLLESMLFHPNVSRYKQVLNYLNRLEMQKGYFYEEFSPNGQPKNFDKSRLYFSSENAGRIDSIRKTIREWHLSKSITDVEHSILLNDLILATNDVANIAGTYGHFMSNFTSRNSRLELKPFQFSYKNSGPKHLVLQEYAEVLSPRISSDLCYIDPPYIKRQYAANYHILETIAREDEPEAIGASGLRPWRDQYSDFCTKTKGIAAFNTILTQMDCPEFLISYSEDGLFPIERLKEEFSKIGNTVVYSIMYRRFKSNKTKSNPNVKEYLIHVSK